MCWASFPGVSTPSPGRESHRGVADLRGAGFEKGHLGVQGPGAAWRSACGPGGRRGWLDLDGKRKREEAWKPLYSFIRARLRVSPGGQALYQAASMPTLGEARPIWGVGSGSTPVREGLGVGGGWQ